MSGGRGELRITLDVTTISSYRPAFANTSATICRTAEHLKCGQSYLKCAEIASCQYGKNQSTAYRFLNINYMLKTVF